jgi:hypothetical protein
MPFVYHNRVKPDALEPRFRADVEALLAEDPDRWLITYGTRTLAEQAALYEAYLAGGPKAAPPGRSAHNYGLGVDLVLDRDPWTPAVEMDWDIRHAAWQRLFLKLKAHPRLKSGVSFGDGGHIERYRWSARKNQMAPV